MLEEAGHPMHIKEIKQRIIDRGLVQSKYSVHLPHNIAYVLAFKIMRMDVCMFSAL